jgi:transaldolase
VSLEVDPHLARDTEGTIEEARRLWTAVDRPNLMIKVPATEAGIPAIEQLLSEGINVNVTLMFSLDHYEKVARSYLRGLRAADDPSGILSVASFFVSRVAREVDTRLEERGLTDTVDFDGSDVAIANAKMAYRRFREIFHGEAFADLREQGAAVQRPLWASTSTKDPTRSDVLYVETLIGEETVNTVPPATLDAFRDHGAVGDQPVAADLDWAEAVLDRLDEVGIDLDDVTETLQDRGVEKFVDPFDDLMETLEEKRQALLHDPSAPIAYHLNGLEGRVVERLEIWQTDDVACRLWRRDPTLWADEDTPEITNRLGIHPFNQPNVEAAKRLAREAMQSEDGAATAQTRTISGDDRGALERAVADWLGAADDTSYVALQAYLPPTPDTDRTLRALQETIRDETGLATTLGYGPRFLHSTGQLHKGGPPNGLFLQLVDTPEREASVPETDFTFKELIAAQAAGDYQALREAGRTVLRVRVDDASLDRLADVITG